MSKAISSPTEYLLADSAGYTLTITLNRPEALNALTPEMLEGIQSLVQHADQNEEIFELLNECHLRRSINLRLVVHRFPGQW